MHHRRLVRNRQTLFVRIKRTSNTHKLSITFQVSTHVFPFHHTRGDNQFRGASLVSPPPTHTRGMLLSAPSQLGAHSSHCRGITVKNLSPSPNRRRMFSTALDCRVMRFYCETSELCALSVPYIILEICAEPFNLVTFLANRQIGRDLCLRLLCLLSPFGISSSSSRRQTLAPLHVMIHLKRTHSVRKTPARAINCRESLMITGIGGFVAGVRLLQVAISRLNALV